MFAVSGPAQLALPPAAKKNPYQSVVRNIVQSFLKQGLGKRFHLWGPQWVLNFDSGARAGADRWSVVVSHMRQNTRTGYGENMSFCVALKKKALSEFTYKEITLKTEKNQEQFFT